MTQRAIKLLLTASAIVLLLPAQSLTPAYLSEMPDPARVIGGIQGKDVEDTGERQMGAFMALVKMMDDMAWGLEHRYVNDADTRKLTPDERRVRLAYQTAYAELWKKVSNKEGHIYDHDRELLHELLSKFFSENFRSLYFKSNANAAAAYKAFHDRMYAAPAPAPASQTQSAPKSGPGTNSETMRCIASGRPKRICLSEGMSGGLEEFLGVNMKTPVPGGLRMTGDYQSASGFRVIFEPEAATMVCRDVPEPAPYTVQINGPQVLIKIQGGPTLSMTPDGKLAGSGPITITGQVPTGSHKEQTMGTTSQRTGTTHEMTALEARGQGYTDAQMSAMRNGQTYTAHDDAAQWVYGSMASRNVTDYTTKTTNCTVSLLNPSGPSPLPLLKNDFDILTTIGTGVGAMLNGQSVQDATKEMLTGGPTVMPGLRLNGRYAGEGGFSLTFHRESVTLGCGEAEQAFEYNVRRNGSNTTLVINRAPDPISLRLMPDGSIAGEGTLQVNGRIITGTKQDMNDPFVFAPRAASCPVGRLVLGASIPGTATPVSSAPVSATPASSAPVTSTPGGTSLRITAGPGVASLLAGKTMMVVKEDLESILAKSGISATQPATRIATWTHACERAPRDPICQQGISGLRSYIVARATFDPTGTAAFNNIPTLGTFYIVADTSYSHHLLWNVRVDLKSGPNTVTLGEDNKTNVER